MFGKIKKNIIGFFGGAVVVAFVLGKKLHDNGDRINDARDKIKYASSGLDTVSGGLDTVSNGLKEVSERIEHSKDTVTDCFGIIEKVRKRKQ